MNGRKARAQRRSAHGTETHEPLTPAQQRMAEDRAYFARHPGRWWRLRRCAPDDFGPNASAAEKHATHFFIVHKPGTTDYFAKAMLILDPADYPTGVIPREHAEAADALFGEGNGTMGWLSRALVDDGISGDGAPAEEAHLSAEAARLFNEIA